MKSIEERMADIICIDGGEASAAGVILRLISKEIEKVENPYDGTDELAEGLWLHIGFEACRQGIVPFWLVRANENEG